MNQKYVSIALSAVGLLLGAQSVWAHSASDAYLNLDVQKREASSPGMVVVHGQWDIALRDLDFVIGLDDDGDGTIVWRELRAHQEKIARYAYDSLRISGDGNACSVAPTNQKVANHSDGAYAALFFDATCKGSPKRLRIDYSLLFKVDPSHRGIAVIRSADSIATSVLSPENARIELAP